MQSRRGLIFIWAVLILFGGFTRLEAQTFTNVATTLPGVDDPGSLIWGDLDNDGRLDVILTGDSDVDQFGYPNTPIAQAWRNTGSGFVKYFDFPGGVTFGSVALADYDNDGRLDVALAGYTSFNTNIAQVWHNTGSGFVKTFDFPVTGFGTMAWGDFDGDGLPDLVIAASTLTFWRNTGTNFVQVGSLPGFFSSVTIRWGDYDNDGRLDLLISGQVSGGYATQVWHNTPYGFVKVYDVSSQNEISSAYWGDYDNDGLLDFIVTGVSYPPITQLYHNTGSGFTNVPVAVTGFSAGGLSWGDYDNDGRLDILLSGSPNGSLAGTATEVWRNTGSGFTNINAGLMAFSSGSAAWGDYDNDGRLDVLACGYTNVHASIQLARNISPVTNTPPTTPTGLAFRVAGGKYQLSWNRSTDAQTPSAVLTYNIRIGTTPGGMDVISPMSSSAGLRRLPQAGNMGILTNTLPALLQSRRTYYWSVQAVDSGYAGSAFAGEQSFTITNPVVQTRLVSDLAPFSATLNGIVSPSSNTYAWFQYGITTNYGSTTPATSIPGTGGIIDFSNAISGLTPAVLYHYRIVATNMFGTSFGDDLTFTTLGSLPIVVTAPAANITPDQATLNADVTPASLPTQAWFEWGTDTNYANRSTNFDVGSGPANVPVSLALTGLTFNVTYHYRIVATNLFGTNYGADFSFIPALPGVFGGSYAWGDYDNDGLLDVLVMGYSEGGRIAQVWRNTGNGFTNINAGLPGLYYGACAWGDFDNDGRLDILITGQDGSGNGVAQVWRNTGNGFTNINAAIDGVISYDNETMPTCQWADYDNDGRLDILLAGYSSTTGRAVTQIWHNDGNGIFSAGPSFSGYPPAQAYWLDYDKDGQLDVLILHSHSYQELWRNLGDGSYSNVFSNSLAGSIGVFGEAVADFDSDGQMDFITYGDGQNGLIDSALWKITPGGFSNVNAFPTGLGNWNSKGAVGDYDNDGLPDIVFVGYHGQPPYSEYETLWHNTASGFVATNIGLLPAQESAVAWGDYDNDGRLDLLQGGYTLVAGSYTNNPTYGARGQLWHNLVAPQNTIPFAPGNLTAVRSGTGMLLSWSPGSDAETPTAALTYNIRVGTTPGGSDIVSPESDSVTGWHRLPQGGNTQNRLFTYLDHFHATNFTTYYWSVQTIDGIYAGSTWAPEASFTRLELAPGVTTLAATFVTSSNAVLNGTINPIDFASGAFFQYGTDPSFTNLSAVTITIPGELSGTNTLPITTAVSNLQLLTTYYFRAFSTNLWGTNYGTTLSFATRGSPDANLTNIVSDSGVLTPAFTPAAVSYTLNLPHAVTNISLTATLEDPNASIQYRFDGGSYGPISSGAAMPPQFLTSGSHLFEFKVTAQDAVITKLYSVTVVRAPGLPEVVTLSSGGPTATSTVTLNGTANPSADPTMAWFEYGTNLSYGSVTPLVNVGNGGVPVSVNSGVVGLMPQATYHYHIAASNSFGLVTGTDQSFTTAKFVVVNGQIPGVVHGAVAWGDFDRDGYPDVLISGYSPGLGPITRVYRNLGNGTFTNMNVNLPGLTNSAVAWGDFDNDGWLDFVICGTTNGFTPITRLYKNNNGTSFSVVNAGLPGFSGGSVAWGDYDNDGRLDLLFTGDDVTANDIPQIYHNNGNGTFTLNSTANLPMVFGGSVGTWADFDGDGRLDILLTGVSTNFAPATYLLRNTGNGFTLVPTGIPGVQQASVAWGDYDNDGWPDILLSGQPDGVFPITQVWHNTGGAFTNLNAGLPGLRSGSVAWGDYDNDGRLDILLTGTTDGSTPLSGVWRNAGDGFTNLNAGIPGVAMGNAAFADFDHNGTLDVLITGAADSLGNSAVTGVFVTVPTSNTIPTTPFGLQSSVTGSGVSLTWSASSDVETPAAGLSYNVRLGTTPGGSQIASAMASITNGLRYLWQSGNVPHGLQLMLTNLPAGQYYWSVQAIDTARAGSPFAFEGNFSIGQPMILSIERLPDGRNHLRCRGLPGYQYGLHGSSDLVTWRALALPIAGSDGTFEYTDASPPLSPTYFYRLRWPF